VRKMPTNPINRKIVELIGNEYGAVKQFAAKADIDCATLRVCLSRDDTPTVSTLVAISRAFEVSLDYLCADYKPDRRFWG